MNGVSVSKSAKIGERPYPSPFHPVEIRGKIRENHSFVPVPPQFSVQIPIHNASKPSLKPIKPTKIQFTRSLSIFRKRYSNLRSATIAEQKVSQNTWRMRYESE